MRTSRPLATVAFAFALLSGVAIAVLPGIAHGQQAETDDDFLDDLFDEELEGPDLAPDAATPPAPEADAVETPLEEAGALDASVDEPDLEADFADEEILAEDEIDAGEVTPPSVGPPSDIEEILIQGTSQAGFKLESETQSVTEFGSEDLAALGIEDVTDLSGFTPNLEIVSPGETTATFFIRGVGLSDFSSNAAGAVAIYQDGVPLNSPPLQVGQIFDIESVGVLRGPQGTGPGRNASAGAIQIKGAKPSLSDFTAALSTSQGMFVSDDTPSSRIQEWEGAIGFPIVPDTLGSRLSFKLTDREPHFTNRCASLPTPTQCTQAPQDRQRHVGEQQRWAARGQLLFVPDTDMELEFLLNGHGGRFDGDGIFGQAVGTGSDGRNDFGGQTEASSGYREPDHTAERTGYENQGLTPAQARERFTKEFTTDRPLDKNPYTGDFNKTGEQVLDTWGGFLRASAVFDFMDVSATSAYDGYSLFTDNDTDLTPDRLFEITNETDTWQFYQDLQFNGELEGQPIQWEAGAYYLMEEIENSSFNVIPPSPTTPREYEQELWSYGVYAGITWSFLDDFELTMGGRYNYEKKDFSIRDRIDTGFIVSTREAETSETWTAPTGQVQLLYRFNDEVSTYLKYNRGWKSGHFNSNGVDRDNCAQTSSSPGPPLEFSFQCPTREEADPEQIDAFELGFTATYWDGRLNMTGALFHYDYEDYQVFIFEDEPNNPPTLQVINANDARLFGAEAEFQLEPLRDFVPPVFESMLITLRVGWLDSEFLDFKNEIFVRDPLGGGRLARTTDFSGNPLPNAPEYQVSGGISWPIEIGRFGTLIPRWDFTWKSDTFFDPTEGKGVALIDGTLLPDDTIGQPAFVLHNIRLTWRSPDTNVEVSGWCRNVADQRYKNYAFDVSIFRGVVINYVGDPRSCGGSVSYSW